jgi:glucose-6-phosphate isomerase
MSVNESGAWLSLERLAAELDGAHINDLFEQDSRRFEKFNASLDNFVLDYSKQRLTKNIVNSLVDLAGQQDLKGWIEKLFTGYEVNNSEKRAALHTALRTPKSDLLILEGENVIAGVHQSLEKMRAIVEKVQNKQWRGFDGSPIKSVVNIGVGGSNLGPLMATEALAQFEPKMQGNLQVHFVTSMDGSELEKILPLLDPASTLFIVSSKSFTTVDTLANANTARDWLLQASQQTEEQISQHHFIATTANTEAALEWGIPEKNQLQLWDWVGGRYSFWSVIGVTIALKIGMDNFLDVLKGAHSMDEHFRNSPFDENLPVLLALIGVWNINFLDIHAHSVLPYDGRLAVLPSYLEQLEMESNGKSVNHNGERITYRTCPVLWGEIGSNAQHAFYQLLHQGTEPVMCDFIVPAIRYQNGGKQLSNQHQLALTNCLAQSMLLALGGNALDSSGDDSHFKYYDGNQPSTTIILSELTPETFGGLIALYEHKVFVQSVIWEINPFDQWGVEQGKQVATSLLSKLKNDDNRDVDSSTAGLISVVQNFAERVSEN